jgi:predicted transcriptional regulator
MAKTKEFEITLADSKGVFLGFGKLKNSKERYDFSGIKSLRKLLSNEKARILYVIKSQKPESIYELSKKLGRPFKAVIDDVKVLEKFGFIDLIENKFKGRIRHKPELAAELINISIKI